MPTLLPQKTKGFTVVELMVVVVLVSILSSVAVSSYMKYIKKGKVTEAQLNLQAIAGGAVKWFNAAHVDSSQNPLFSHFPNSNSPTGYPSGSDVSINPIATPCSIPTHIYPKNTKNWNVQPWLALGFSINKAHYYQYKFVSQGFHTNSLFTVVATGDLDCDSTFSTFELRGTFSPTLGEIELGQIIENNSLE